MLWLSGIGSWNWSCTSLLEYTIKALQLFLRVFLFFFFSFCSRGTFTYEPHCVTGGCKQFSLRYSSHESISSRESSSSGESSSSHESGSSQVPNFFSDVRAATRNINFPVSDIFHSRSKEPLPLCIAIASPRYTTTFNINTFSKNIKGLSQLVHMRIAYIP